MAAWLFAGPALGAATISFGARTQIWPFVFVDDGGAHRNADERVKIGVTLGNLDRYDELGARWNIVDVWQEADGPDDFRRLERAVAEHERRGIQVALRLLETPEIYDRIASGGEVAAAALQEYRQWIEQIARRFGTRVRYYMISNETDHDIGYNRPIYRGFRRVTVDEYRELLRAAFEAIHSVDPRLTVADHGVSSFSLSIAVMADLVLSGRPGEALAFWRSMDYESPGAAERTLPRLLGMLAGAESQRRIEYSRRSTAELARYRDVFQLHHYYGPDVVPAMVDWIRSQMPQAGGVQPIVAAEVGYSMPAVQGKSWDGRPANIADMSRYSEGDHAASVAATLAALAGNGVSDILYWQLRFHTSYHGPAASLYPDTPVPDAFRETQPVEAFRFVARELSGAASVDSTPELRGSDMVEYRFRRGGDLSVIRAAGDKPVAIPPALRSRIARIADAAGRPVPVGTWGGKIGATPMFVFWQ